MRGNPPWWNSGQDHRICRRRVQAHARSRGEAVDSVCLGREDRVVEGDGNETVGRPGAEALRAAVEGHEAGLGAALLDLEVGPALRRMPGRETFLVDLVDAEAPRAVGLDGDAAGHEVDAKVPAVVKRYAGSDAKEARAELLCWRFPRLPARREAENLLGLAGLGLAVPEVVYFCESGTRSLVVGSVSPRMLPRARHCRGACA